jgi:hypothetical protein
MHINKFFTLQDEVICIFEEDVEMFIWRHNSLKTNLMRRIMAAEYLQIKDFMRLQS